MRIRPAGIQASDEILLDIRTDIERLIGQTLKFSTPGSENGYRRHRRS